MRRIYYYAASTDSGCIIGCPHQHATVVSAVACISAPGGYVIAVENNENRRLNDAEELLFQKAMYNTSREQLLDTQLSEVLLKRLGLATNN
jgi:hypothetical protein